MLIALHYGVLAGMALFPVGAFLLVRLFIIQHDCGHGSFFKSSWANGLLGRALSLVTLTPYAFWRRDHAMHHATTGNLDRRGSGDVTLLTLAEYQALPLFRRIGYRLYRHPLVMFGVGPAWLILWCLRVPRGSPWHRWRDWVSIVGTDAALAALDHHTGADPGSVAGAARLAAGYAAVRRDRRLAVLRPAPVRGSVLGTPPTMGFSCGGAARFFVLRFAARAALDDRQYRVPSHPPSRQPDPELSSAGMPRGEPGVADGTAPDVA